MVAETQLAGLPVELNDEDRLVMVRAASGLTANEAALAFRGAAVKLSGLNAGAARLVVESKTQIIRKTGILDYYDQSESFADVGGLGRLRAWFQSRAAAFSRTRIPSTLLPLPRAPRIIPMELLFE